MSIQVVIKNNYGKESIYPVCEKAKIFARFNNQKTLTLDDIALIKALGYKVEVIQEVKEL